MTTAPTPAHLRATALIDSDAPSIQAFAAQHARGTTDRDRAVAMIKRAKDFAKAVGAPHVTCCPLSDGYDVLFQINYKIFFVLFKKTLSKNKFSSKC